MTDYISRHTVIDALQKERDYLLKNGRTGAEHVLVHHALNVVDEIPAADVRPVSRGKWIHKTTEIRSTGDGFYEGGYWWYECSYCGAKPPHLWAGTEWLSAYCPNCGSYNGGDADG